MNNPYYMSKITREKRKSKDSEEEFNGKTNKECNKSQKMQCNCLKRKIEEIESYINTKKNVEALDKLLKKIKIEEYSAYDYDIY